MGPQVILRITLEGCRPPEILAENEADEKVAEKILARVRSIMDVIDALLGKEPVGL